jgi:predicted Zn-dependent protease with MMP-like domain
MSRHEFKALVRQVMETLPDEMKPYLDNVVVEVADEPDDDLLRRAGFTEEEIEAGESLFGLFDPLDMPHDGIDFQDYPHKLWIFQYPHEDEFEDPKRCRIEIRKTVIHELGHHFGFDERDLERFDANPDPFGDKHRLPGGEA